MVRMVFTVFILVLFLLSPPIHTGENSNVIIVPEDVPSVESALALVSEGGTVKVRRGVYEEYVYVNKSVSIVGEDTPIFLHPLTISSASNVALKGLRFEIYPPGTEPAVLIVDSTGILLEDVWITGAGLLIYDSTGVVVRNCRFDGSPGPALSIRGSSSKRIEVESCIFNRTYTALSVFEGSNVTFRFNRVWASRLAVKFYRSSSNSTVYMNDFLSGEAVDLGSGNLWFNPEARLGNYWGESFNGSDQNGDGILDEPKRIVGLAGSVDAYPLAESYSKYLEDRRNYSLTLVYLSFIVVALLVLAVFLILRRH